MPIRSRTNFVKGTLDASLANSGSDAIMSSPGLADLPAIVAPAIAVVVLDPDAVNGAPEIVYVSAHTAAATTATIQRAKEGSTFRAHGTITRWIHGPTKDDFSGYRLRSFTVITTTGVSTYTVPAGIHAILVECVGAGGGGGGAQGDATNAGAAGGGAAGGYARKFIASPAASYSVTVGDRGLGGSGSPVGPGGGGVGTSFGDPAIITCPGSVGGEAGVLSVSRLVPGGAAGAVPTGGDVNVKGEAGAPGIVLGVGANAQIGGNGGESALGGGGQGGFDAAGTSPSANSGAGGGGPSAASVAGGVNRAGAAGAHGIIIVWEFA